MSLSISQLQDFFSKHNSLDKFYVAYSGGLDSTVLLHIMHAIKLPVEAVHVNHHLQNDCNQWQQQCEKFCSDFSIPLKIQHAQITKQAQTSLEELARHARYALLEELLINNSAMVTAHHQDDLAETILLQLLRGAGPAGLAAMPESKTLSMGIHLRPLLSFSRVDILDYARTQDLQWVDDPSNQCNEFDRNYLRNEVMPILLKRWPSAKQTLARSAELQADTLSCLQDLAELDLQPAKTDELQKLSVTPLQALSFERLNNALRFWITSNNIRVPSKKILKQIVTDIVLKKDMETSPLQTWKEGEIRRFRDHLYLMHPLQSHDASQTIRWKIDQPLVIESLGRTLMPEDLKDAGIAIPEGVSELTIKFREGGERLKPFGSKQHRSLKNLLHEAEVPPWERSRIPLLYHQDQLISVLDFWNTGAVCETKT